MSEVRKLFEQMKAEAQVGAQDAIDRREGPPADIAREAAVYGVKAEDLAPPGWQSVDGGVEQDGPEMEHER